MPRPNSLKIVKMTKNLRFRDFLQLCGYTVPLAFIDRY